MTDRVVRILMQRYGISFDEILIMSINNPIFAKQQKEIFLKIKRVLDKEYEESLIGIRRGYLE